MAKELFILPGIGNPKIESYLAVYSIINDAAAERDYKKIQTLDYPGYITSENTGETLNLNTSVTSITEKISETESLSIPYDIIARSYGCSVLMRILLDNDLKYVDRIVLWGPSPVCNAYKVIMKNEEAAKKSGIEKGARISAETYSSFAADPFEIQLMKYAGKKKIHIGTGELDKHCKPLFLSFLDAYLDYDKRFSYSVISNVGHEVDYPNEDYINFLFPD